MERKAVKQLNMVSRLPKFASRPSGTTMTALPQGSTLPVSSSESKGGPLVRHNNLTRLQSLNWRKGEEDIGNKGQDSDSLDEETSVTSVTPVMVTKKPSPAAAVKCKSAAPTSQSSCPRSIPQPSKTFSRMTTPKRPSTGNPLYNDMASQNGASVGNGRCGFSGPGVGHVSQQRTLQSKLSLSNDSIKSDSKDGIVRSQSFTHSKRATCPTNPPITRSFSFNKATELAKELPRPLAQSPVAKSPLIQPNTVLCEEKVNKYGIPRPAVTTSSHLLQTNTIKKSLLPSFSGNKPSVLSYRLTRPTLTKHPRPVLFGTVQKDAELSKNVQDTTKILHDTTETSSEPSSNVESIETTPDETYFEAKEAEGSLGPSLEDMSLSSSSSVEHNDTSEEYIDDFDNLGNGGETLLLPVLNEGLAQFGLCKDDNDLIGKCDEESSVSSLHTFLSETVDWAGMGLAAGEDGFEHETLSPVGDFPHGSSLDLSPSDSSGGTYMWDEEGMEALGGSGHPCGSFASDLNSMDILDNLENVESCDLEEDDLMLDLDLSEDASLHSDTDGTSPYECSEKDGWPIQRRRRQQLWGRRDQFCRENRSVIFQSFDGRKEPGLERSDQVTLVELKLMTQDCSSVKEQLLQLKTLLQMETDSSVEDTLEANTPSSTDQSLLDQKVALLLKEVQELRNELRSKDRMIAELSQQLSSPVEDMQCRCLQGSEANKESPEHQHKDTQTLWKAHNGILLAPILSSWQHSQRGSVRPCAPRHHRQTSNTTDSQILTQQAPQP
ncbi:serine-rich coiled-coil domain-containing protein 2 isoform X6 [Onychostoma macrolepis]|uniref:serine-rich coiled-coil domain-containing protein 2 isoform X6 n=1 Tax=Onychostoma macrolepis TaxID=369639 RepID=UPI00272CEBDA|nr:serine-rich coiled-coil domain-containing protein 2 isoform X6 [Onychostoma macrolepis]